jgi:hypothetical protein
MVVGQTMLVIYASVNCSTYMPVSFTAICLGDANLCPLGSLGQFSIQFRALIMIALHRDREQQYSLRVWTG